MLNIVFVREYFVQVLLNEHACADQDVVGHNMGGKREAFGGLVGEVAKMRMGMIIHEFVVLPLVAYLQNFLNEIVSKNYRTGLVNYAALRSSRAELPRMPRSGMD